MAIGIDDRLPRACRLIQRFIDRGEFSGAALAVSTDGKTIRDWYAGMAGPDLKSGPDVIWPLASISKLYTVAAVMSLVEEGSLTLSMRVADLLPEYQADERQDTRLWHLLTHTSGLIYESPEMESLLARQTPLSDIVEESFQTALMAPPGERFEYSDYGIAVAARLAEVASGQALAELVRERVLHPGRLEETWMPPPESVYSQIAHVDGVPAAGTDGAMYNSHYCRQLTHPAFGTVASVADLLRFGMLFWEKAETRLLSPATTRAMTRDQLGGGLPGGLVGQNLRQPQPWGLGFLVRGKSLALGFGELASPSAFGHPGASGCLLLIDPEQSVAMAFVSNSHAVLDFDRFLFREASIANAVLSDLTRE